MHDKEKSETYEDFSYGIIPLRRIDEEWEVLLVKHHAGHWGFPKGHPEKGEEGRQTAMRELNEETGLTVKNFVNDQIFTEKYEFNWHGKLCSKVVTYYPSEVEGEVLAQAEELEACLWVRLKEAVEHLTFPEAQSIARRVVNMMDGMKRS